MRKESIHTAHEAPETGRGRTRRLIVRWAYSSFLVIGASFLGISCSEDSPASTGMEGDEGTDSPGQVTLVIGSAATRAAGDSPTSDEVRTLRVFAYDATADDNAAPIGHKYLDDLSGTGPFYAEMELQKRGQVKFYALVNEVGADAANESIILLDGNTTQTDLNNYRIGRTLQDYGNGYAIPMSSLADADGEGNRTFTIAATSRPQYVNLTATRVLSRLRLYFATYETEQGQVQITGATLTQGPASVHLTMEETTESLANYYVNASNITVIGNGSPVTVNTSLNDPNAKLTATNTQLVATAYMPENPYGASDKNANEEWNGAQAGTGEDKEKAYKLTVNYRMGTQTKTKDIYLPSVERNQTVNVFGLLRGADIELHIRVADWEVEEVELGAYPTCTCMPKEGSDYSTVTEYVDTNNETDKLNKAFCVKFTMNQPEGQKFTPVLSGNESRFTLKVYNSAGADITDKPDEWIGGKDLEYELYVVPTGEYDAEDENRNSTYLMITTQTWGGDNDPLLINPDLKWNEKDSDKSNTKIKVTINK